ncbi:MAG: indolepyruvate oxidoreductase subunit beta [Christensenellales bacterium]|jgi:indolepyruvate ferredoxin oxidoreductase beta subunit
MSTNVLIVGVGGQGTLLASRLLGNVAMGRGYDVKMSEVHGMSQRGGSVVTYVRYGEELYSPLVERGQADYIVAFELLEAMRYVHYLKEGGRIIVNTQKILPMPVITGGVDYPQDLPDQLKAACPSALMLDALALARSCGSERAVNTVLMGVLAMFLEFSPEDWDAALRVTLKPKILDMNMKAFHTGLAWAKQNLL